MVLQPVATVWQGWVVTPMLVAALATHLVLAAAELPPPFVRAARLADAPPMDSARLIYSWQWATGFCGMLEADGPGEPRFLGSGHDAGWWVAYHEKIIYLAMMIPTPDETTVFQAEATRDGDSRLATDDHLVVQLSSRGRENAAAGKSLRIRLNINGASLVEEVEFLPGQTRALAADAIRVLVSDKQESPGANWFTAKLAIPAALLGLESLDGQTLLAHLAFAAPPLYLSWGGARPGDWSRAGELLFDPAAPANIRINPSHPRLFGTLGQDSIRLNVGAAGAILRGDGGQVRLHLANRAAEQTLFAETLAFADVGTGKRYRLPLQTTFAADATGENRFDIHAVHQGADGQETTLLRQHLPFASADDELLARLADWRLARRRTRPADFEADYIFSPYTDQLEVMVETTIMPNALAAAEREKGAAIAAADRFAVELRDGQGATMVAGGGSVAASRGSLRLDLPSPFPAGDYAVDYRLLHGDQEVGRKTLRLTREHFPWEKNSLGLDKVVIPPFTPITVDGLAVAVVGRRHLFGDTGLPVSITSQGTELLAGPIVLQGQVAGQAATLTSATPIQITTVEGTMMPAAHAAYEFAKGACPPPELVPTDGYQATVAATGMLGALPVQVTAVVEYEGWCRFTVVLQPNGPTAVDRLDLVMPLTANASLMKWWRGHDPQLTGVGRIPPGEGVLFASTDLPQQAGVLNSLTPIVYLGAPDRGLWVFVESEQGWSVDDARPLTSLVRENGQLLLKYHIVNQAVEIAAPRRFEFVLMASPARPRPPDYRRLFWKQLFSHDAAGFRLYGSGVNGFTLYTDEDYQGLRRFIYESEGRYATGKAAQARQGAPMTLYGAISSASAGMREFPTFGSAWILTAHLRKRFLPAIQFRGRLSIGGTYTWETDEQITPIATTMDAAYIDCNLWHMTEIAHRCGINGTFFDNYQPFPPERFRNVTDLTGVCWRRPDGSIQPKSNVFRRHDWQKRVATALWLLGRPPHQIGGNEPESTFMSNWFVEGVNDVEGGSDFIRDGKDIDTYAAWLATTSGLGQASPSIQMTTDATGQKSLNLRAIRLATAYCLLLDQPLRRKGQAYANDAPVRDLCDALDREVGFFADARHLPYWRDTGWLIEAPAGLVVGGYLRADAKKAVLVVINAGETEVDGRLTVDAGRLLGGPATRAYDLEDGTQANRLVGDHVGVRLEPHAVGFIVLAGEN